MLFVLLFGIFCFKQKTAYEMRISDWSSDVCSSDLWSGAKGMARCPAHDDRTPSLGVTLGRRAILFHCFAGCSQDQVLTALAGRGVSPASMFSGQVEINAGDGARKPAHHAFAERIWREAAPLGDTLAQAYLEARGIRAVSRALRFHPLTPPGPRGKPHKNGRAASREKV